MSVREEAFRLSKLIKNGDGYNAIKNNLYTYEISDETIFLHMTYDISKVIKKYGASKIRRVLNLQLLDAINALMCLIEQKDKKTENIKNLYMLSPLLYGKTEMNILEQLGFETKSFKKGTLRDEESINNDIEAMNALDCFGKEHNVGRAFIGINTIQSLHYQGEKNQIVKKYSMNGITSDLVAQIVGEIINNQYKRRKKIVNNICGGNSHAKTTRKHDFEIYER